ncbi:MAG: 4-hydroxy-3-methylbut-2-enyl diphosphate reductase [Armatimonadota bacterium]
MRVVVAESYGMCFGVRDAIEMALQAPEPQELTVLGELVHNPVVLRRLGEAGIRTVASLDSPVETRRAMVTAHGASRAAVARLRSQGLEVLEATCPLVSHAHRMLDRLVADGYFPVVIGKPEHVEVRGLIGDLDEYVVLSGPEELPLLAGRSRIGVVSQTTQPLEYVLEMVDRIRETYPQAQVKFADTVCQPTKQRQLAARRLGSECEVVIVVGGRHSNNTRQLVRACEREGARAYQVERVEELEPEWLEGVETVGLTAGTSTPEETVEEVRRALELYAAPLSRAA